METMTDRSQTGFYCSTSGTYFTDKESLAEHYKSDFHKYNLKRKLAGLPPVTKEWFDARKSQLSSVTSQPTDAKVWIDPVTKKKFSSENTYMAHVKSKKYQDLLKKLGQPAPEPVVVYKKEVPAVEASSKEMAKAAGYTIKSTPAVAQIQTQKTQDQTMEQPDKDLDAKSNSSWETASDDDDTQDAAMEDVWDARRSLFDNHMSESLEANLRYMSKHFGFSVPDAKCVDDMEGLIKYLGAKLQVGHVPLYSRGDDANARQFGSLHAVQRHMVDTNQCRMVYEENEEEYEDFYNYEEKEDEEKAFAGDGDTEMQMVLRGNEEPTLTTLGYELVTAKGKVLGSRDLARYYRQFRPFVPRGFATGRNFLRHLVGIGGKFHMQHVRIARERKIAERHRRSQINLFMKSNVIRNLPKNVPY